MSSDSSIPLVDELREKYTYNIYPCGVQPSSEGRREGAGGKARLMAPLPSRGGSFCVETSDRDREKDEKEKAREREGEREKEKERERGKKRSSGKRLEVSNESSLMKSFGRGCTESSPMEVQVKQLHEHYSTVARQPSRVSCNLELAPPIARAFCPQQQRDPNPIPYYMAYAADVPLEVLEQSRALSGFDLLAELQEHRKDQFALSLAQSPKVVPVKNRPGQPHPLTGRDRVARKRT